MIPAPHRMAHQRHAWGPPDGRGNRTDTWTDAGEVAVHSISGPEGELAAPARPGGRVDLITHGPASLSGVINPRDRLVIDGTAHTVVQVLDWTKGPWTFPAAGVEIHLRQVEGVPTL